MTAQFRTQWRTTDPHAAGQHHADHDTEAEADARAVVEARAGAQAVLVYEIEVWE